MTQQSEASAISSAAHVRQVAQRLASMSEAIHCVLRQLAQDLHHGDSSSAYALLTEEYALRARTNILQVEATRFARASFPATQLEMISILDNVNEALTGTWSAEELTELVVSLVLFATSIACRNNTIIALLLNDLHKMVMKPRATRTTLPSHL